MESTLEWLIRTMEKPLIWVSHLLAGRVKNSPSPASPSLGVETYSGRPFSLTPNQLRLHCYLIGSTGVGKTNVNLSLMEQDIRSNHSFVVVDMRGDLVTGALALCHSLGTDPKRVVLLDLREKIRIQGFNPLSGAGEPHIRALHLSDVIAHESDSWGVQLEETLRNALLLLATAGEPITRLEEVFYDDGFRGSCLSKTVDESLAGFWERFGNMSADKRQAWALPVLNKVTPLMATPTLRAVLAGVPDVDLAAQLERPGSIILVSLAVDELHRSSRMIGSLVISSIAREMLARVNVPERLRNPVRLYVDEFENMASESFENLIAEGRRFGLTLVLSHQTLSQLPSRLRSVIRNNVGVQIVFQVGFEDAIGIAKELSDDVSASDLRSLGVGKAFVMWRDGETVHVSFARANHASSEREIEAYRDSVLACLSAPAKPLTPAHPPAVNVVKPVLDDLL